MFKWVNSLIGRDIGEQKQRPQPAERRAEPPPAAGRAIELTLDGDDKALGSIIGPWALGRNASSIDPGAAREHILSALEGLAGEHSDEADRRFLNRLGRCLATQDLDLPQFPDVARELNEMMSDPRTDASRLARLVERDPSLVQRVWTQASSARYRSAPEGLHEAIARVGTSQLWRIAMRAAFDSAVFKVPAYQEEAEEVRFHGYATAEVAAWMAGEMRGPAYLSGLLHDVGKLIIYRGAAGSSQSPDPALVHQVIHEHHAGVGVLVGAAWCMDNSVAAGLGFHHDPGKAPPSHRKLAWFIRISDIISHTAWHQRLGNSVPGLQAISAVPGLKLNMDDALQQAHDALDRFAAPGVRRRAG